MVTARPWDVSGGLWELIEPLLPPAHRPSQQPSQQSSHLGDTRRSGEREALSGILYVLYTGIAWRQLPPELGFGSGATCRRQRDEWEQAGVWNRLYELLLAHRQRAGETDWAPAVVDGSREQSRTAASERPAREPGRSTVSPSLTPAARAGSRSRVAAATPSPG
jgi:transposase